MGYLCIIEKCVQRLPRLASMAAAPDEGVWLLPANSKTHMKWATPTYLTWILGAWGPLQQSFLGHSGTAQLSSFKERRCTSQAIPHTMIQLFLGPPFQNRRILLSAALGDSSTDKLRRQQPDLSAESQKSVIFPSALTGQAATGACCAKAPC